MTTVITAKLSLALRLIDTTTGKELQELDIRFYRGENILRPMRKGDATYVFVNEGREDFLMHITARGYDEADIQVTYEKLDQRLPMIDVFLMPSERNRVGGQVLEIHGSLSEPEYIEAINLNRPIALYHSIQQKKDIVKLTLLPMTAGGGVVLDNMTYAMLDQAKERYDWFKVREQEAQLRVLLDGPPEGEHKLNDEIFRIIYGRAGPDGRFTLKVRDDGSTLPYLIRFKTGGKVYYRHLDFHEETGEIDLLEGAVLKETEAEEETVTEKEEEKDE